MLRATRLWCRKSPKFREMESGLRHTTTGKLIDDSSRTEKGIGRKYMKGHVEFILVYKKSGEVINKEKLRGFRTTSLPTYDFCRARLR